MQNIDPENVETTEPATAPKIELREREPGAVEDFNLAPEAETDPEQSLKEKPDVPAVDAKMRKKFGVGLIVAGAVLLFS